jgi:hypothetical protein
LEGAAPPRPTRYDPRVISAAIDKLAPNVLDWADDPSVELEDVTSDLTKAMKSVPFRDDGYTIAKAMEDQCGYSPDAQLVEILDRAGWEMYDAHKALEREWVTDWDIKLKHAVGDAVKFEMNRQAYEGVICETDPALAEYTVSVPDEGHIGHLPKPDRPGMGGTTGYVVKAEWVKD